MAKNKSMEDFDNIFFSRIRNRLSIKFAKDLTVTIVGKETARVECTNQRDQYILAHPLRKDLVFKMELPLVDAENHKRAFMRPTAKTKSLVLASLVAWRLFGSMLSFSVSL